MERRAGEDMATVRPRAAMPDGCSPLNSRRYETDEQGWWEHGLEGMIDPAGQDAWHSTVLQSFLAAREAEEESMSTPYRHLCNDCE